MIMIAAKKLTVHWEDEPRDLSLSAPQCLTLLTALWHYKLTKCQHEQLILLILASSFLAFLAWHCAASGHRWKDSDRYGTDPTVAGIV